MIGGVTRHCDAGSFISYQPLTYVNDLG